MRKFFYALGVAGLILFVSCRKEEENKRLEITIGTVCGWCMGEDSLVIDKDNIRYDYNGRYCSSSNEVRIDTLTDKKEWNGLVAKLDLSEFKKVNVNSCDVCVDGCDTWITIHQGGYCHHIKFGMGDSAAISKIKPFINKLDSIRSRFRTNTPFRH